jgi:hypothetical protein
MTNHRIKYNILKQWKSLSLLLLLLILSGLIGCSKSKTTIPVERILVRIGDRVITVDEFIRRAEYTIRPKYCKGDNYIHRKIILNSLIAEKLMALEAGTKNELCDNPEFQNYIEGRKEQAMRQYYYYDRAYNRIKPDSAELNRIYQLAGRTYRMQYLRLRDEKTAEKYYRLYQDKGFTFEKLAAEVLQDPNIPIREIGFNDDLNEATFKTIFSEPLRKDEVLHPVKSDDGSYLLMKVAGWTDEVIITVDEINKRRENVSKKIKTIQADQLYREQVADIMHGKILKFNEHSFYRLEELLAPFYLKTMQEKQAAFNQKFWDKGLEVELDTGATRTYQALRDEQLFTLAGQIWTVTDFEQEVQVHPLVFRKRQISHEEFPEQLKYAIADLIRDKYINNEAYKAGYDKLPAVQNYTTMWQDNLIALYWRNQYLAEHGFRGNFGKEYLKAIREYLNPYVDSLQAKYSDEIEINTDAFEKIKLTDIDLFALQSGVPYPIISPTFPILTTDNKLNYGRKLQVQQATDEY